MPPWVFGLHERLSAPKSEPMLVTEVEVRVIVQRWVNKGGYWFWMKGINTMVMLAKLPFSMDMYNGHKVAV